MSRNTRRKILVSAFITFILLYMISSKLVKFVPIVSSNGTYRADLSRLTEEEPEGVICYVPSPGQTLRNSLGCIADERELFKNVEFDDVSSNLTFLGFDNFKDCLNTRFPVLPEVPVIVSGASQNHYYEAVALCDSINKTLRRMYKDVQLFIYDLGIRNNRDREVLERFCGCEIRKFPFSSFPNHVSNVQGYTWKPLIISLMLNEFPYVMWVDTSIRFDLNKNITTLFNRSRTCDIQQLTEPDWAIGETSDPKTMQFLNQSIQDYLNTTDVESGWGVYVRTKFLMQRIIKPWVTCALTYGCMLTDTYAFATGCNRPPGSLRKAGLCHRFDQTVLGIILTNLYQDRINNVLFGEKLYGDVLRGDVMSIPLSFLERISPPTTTTTTRDPENQT